MTQLRRTPFAFFYAEDQQLLDVTALLQGENPKPGPRARVLALAVLTGERHRLLAEELEALLRVPAETWVDDQRVDPELARGLLHKGLLLSDTEEQPFKSLRERDEALSANEWNLFGALYHYMTKWSGVDISREDQEDPVLGDHARQEAEAFVAEHGPPPPEFAEPRSDKAVPLPGAVREGDLYRAL
ncbi:MAG TPA: hypothetical protein VGF93_14780, partial [Solirubrobacteraceae bacterium]